MKKLVLVLTLLVHTLSFSQIPEIIWQQCYGDQENNNYQTIERTENGYIIGIGINSSENVTNYHGSADIWILMTDSINNMIWEKCYGGSDTDNPTKILQINDSDFFIFGSTASTDGDVQSGNNGFNDMWVVKINAQGDIIWENTYGCTGYDDLRDMIITPDGGFVLIDRIGVGGGDVTNFYGIGDVWMCKCDSLGNIEWEKTLGNEGLDNCISMIINSENNIIMIGAAQKHGGLVECYPDEAWGDVWLVELDLQGNIISQHCYGGSNYDLGYDIIELEEGYAFVASVTSNDGDVTGLHGPPGGPPGGWDDIWIVRLNEQFEISWQKCIGGFGSDSPNYLTNTQDGSFIVIGTTFSHDGDVSGNNSLQGGYYKDIWVIKITSIGEIEWEHCYGGENNEYLHNHCVLKKEDYNFVIAAQAKMNSIDVQCELSGNIDAWVFEIDLEDTTGIYNTPATQDNVKVYPNPAGDYVVFSTYAKASLDDGEVIIFDVFGKEIVRLPVKEEKTVFDLRQWQEGVYFYQFNVEGVVYFGKIIVQR